MSHDTLLHRLVRPPMRLAAHTPISPNQITTLRLVTGLGAAVAFSAGRPLWWAVGAGLLLLSLLLDRADGELARQTGKSSQGGYRYDLLSDFIGNVSAFIGMGVGSIGVMGPLAIGLGLSAGVSIVVLFYMLNVAKVSTVRSVSAGGRALVDPDDALVLVPFMIWLGWQSAVLAIAGTVTPMAALVVVSRAALRRFRPSARD